MSAIQSPENRSRRPLLFAAWVGMIIVAGLLVGAILLVLVYQNRKMPRSSGSGAFQPTLTPVSTRPAAASPTDSPTRTPLPSTPTRAPSPTAVVSQTLTTGTLPQSCTWPPERALVISVDGLRTDAITGTLSMPFLWGISFTGAYTWEGTTTRPSITMPGHVSMLTGYNVNKHGAVDNKLWQTPEAKVKVPSVFQRAKEKGLVTSLISGKKHLGYLYFPQYVDYFKIQKARNPIIAKLAVDYILNHDFGFMFVNFAWVDEIGHDYLWMSPTYLEEAGRADRGIERIFGALKERGLLESTLVIITTDHGGTGNSHGDASIRTNSRIFWIAVGPCVKPGYAIPNQVYGWDTAVTVMWALGLERSPDLDGRPLCEAFEDDLGVACP